MVRHDGCRHMRLDTTMQLFHRWHRARAGLPTRLRTMPRDWRDASLGEIEEEVIRERIEAMRPALSWAEVADTLGVNKRTLYSKRKQYGFG